ncbi:allergin-1 isoform X16 [Symphalangus syndactylus]|uniref:allergin-1 isoform X16 n=1 Tax=Symphalangus syndactylus TaxID=9590 RepID=UPI0024421A87|nr:allergin-1 isoform X10 [Symphalangus syndactylus]
MWSHLNRLLFWSIFSSVTCKKAVLDCEAMKTNEFPSPCLDSKTNVVMKGQNVSMFCSHKNKSLQITYSLFRHKTHLGTQDGKGEPAIFNLSITEAHESGPYKCKAQVTSCSKYSRDFSFTIVGGDSCPFCLKLLLPGLLLLLVVIILILAFWVLPKYKARKAMRNNVPRDCGGPAVEVGIYANILEKQAKEESVPEVGSRPCVSTAQDEAEHSQELQYATPVFQEVAPREQEACDSYKSGYVYSELNF